MRRGRARARPPSGRAKSGPAARRGGWLREPSRARPSRSEQHGRRSVGLWTRLYRQADSAVVSNCGAHREPPSTAMAAAGAAPECAPKCIEALAVVLAHPEAALMLGVATLERNPGQGLNMSRVRPFARRFSMAVTPATSDAKRAAQLARARSFFALVSREMRSRVDNAWPAQDRARDGDLRVPAAYSAFVGRHVTRGKMSAVERAAADALEQPRQQERRDPAAVAFAAFTGTPVRGEMSAVERAAGERLLQPAHEERDDAAVAFAAFSGTPVDGGMSAVQRAAASELQQPQPQPHEQQDDSAAVAFAAFFGTRGGTSAVQRAAASALQRQLQSRRR